MATKKMVCPNCAALRDTKRVERTEVFSVRNEKIAIPVRVQVCATCGEAVFDEKRDQALLERAYAERNSRNQGALLPQSMGFCVTAWSCSKRTSKSKSVSLGMT